MGATRMPPPGTLPLSGGASDGHDGTVGTFPKMGAAEGVQSINQIVAGIKDDIDNLKG